MLDSLITSRTRINLLLKFFLNSQNTSYLRDLESEFGGSTNAIRMELNRMEQAGLLHSHKDGNKKLFQANRNHPLFDDIHNILMKHTGLDQVMERVIDGLGGLDRAYLTGEFARGKDNPVLDLLLVGSNINENYLLNVVRKSEKYISRRIRYIIVKPVEADDLLDNYPEALLLWAKVVGRR